MKDFNDKLSNYVNEAIEAHSGEIAISPTFIARKVVSIIDSENISLPMVTYGFNLQVRSVARSILKAAFDPFHQDGLSGQTEMFTGLCPRYPARRSSTEKDNDSTYVIRSELTLDERNVIPKRLKLSASTMLKHARAFEAETQLLIDNGYFKQGSENVAM